MIGGLLRDMQAAIAAPERVGMMSTDWEREDVRERVEGLVRVILTKHPYRPAVPIPTQLTVHLHTVHQLCAPGSGAADET